MYDIKPTSLIFWKACNNFLILEIEYYKLCFGYIINMTNKFSTSVGRLVYNSYNTTYPSLHNNMNNKK